MNIFARTGQWYLNRETGQHFEIVAMDEHTGSIGIQYVDGDLDELEAEIWAELPLRYAAGPEDASAGFAETDGLIQMANEDNLVGIPPEHLIDRLEGDTFEGLDPDL